MIRKAKAVWRARGRLFSATKIGSIRLGANRRHSANALPHEEIDAGWLLVSLLEDRSKLRERQEKVRWR